jgi:Flp pilus assembly pilin Flp
MRPFFSLLFREISGQELTEYALLLVLITLAVATVLPFFSNILAEVYNNVADAFVGKQTCCD